MLAFLGSSGVTQPSQSQITGIQDAIAHLRRASAGDEVLGHRDGYATACPGGPLYALVQDDTLDPGSPLYDGGTHTVAVNETLGDISLKYNVPRTYIIAVNDLKEPYTLIVGDELAIPARGVPLGEDVPEGGDNGGETPPASGYIPFPGTEWFKAAPYSPIVTAMGKRLVAEGCGEYTSGPGPQWTETDRASYQNWQEKLGFSGTDADGWPGRVTWDQLKVPRQTAVEYVVFPGADWFTALPSSPIITAMGKRLVAEGCGAYEHGPGPQWTEADRLSYQLWQEKLGYAGADADGWPGQTTWNQLQVPRS